MAGKNMTNLLIKLKLKHQSKAFQLYSQDYDELKRQLKAANDTDFPFGTDYPILYERTQESGTMRGAYFHQDLYVARRVFENNPRRHADIGSRIDGFVAHIAAFRKIEVFDIRGQESEVKNIFFTKADLMNLEPSLIDSCDSISSLHAIEHFGLGRYSDPVDAYGHLKAIDNIHKMLQKDGIFYFSVPIGPQRIEFNAHRVFSISYLLRILKDLFEVERFSYVNDPGYFFENISLSPELIENNCGCHYGCGIFELKKKIKA